MNTKMASYMLNFGIILVSVYGGPFLLDVFGISGPVLRMLSIGLLAGGLTLLAMKIGLLPHLRQKNEDPDKGSED